MVCPWEHLTEAEYLVFRRLHSFLILYAGLDLNDMGAAHHEKAQPALADTAADGQGAVHYIIEKYLMEGECAAMAQSACMLFSKPIDFLGDEFVDYVKDGMSITIKEDGVVCVD